MSSVSRVFVCSKIPRLVQAMEAAVPKGVEFQEVRPEDVEKEELTKSWSREVVVADGDFIPTLMMKPKGTVEFVQATWAGVDPVFRFLSSRSDVKPDHLKVCRLSHPVFTQFMAEYLVAAVINAERKHYQLWELQKRKEWSQSLGQDYRSLRELTVGILGVGEIGKASARLFKAFGCRVEGLVRRMPPSSPSPDVDEYFGIPDLRDLLSRCDYVCSVLPSTRDTNDLLAGDALQSCSGRGSVLVNIGRGNVCSTADISRALDSGWISGAVLDVFPSEPLPTDDALWEHPRAVITPHVAAASRPKEIAECLANNLKLLGEGKPLACTVNWQVGY